MSTTDHVPGSGPATSAEHKTTELASTATTPVTAEQPPVGEPPEAEEPAQGADVTATVSTARGRLRTRVTRAARTVPAVVWWITALHVALLLAYSILLPAFRAPDEPQHVDLAHLFAQETRYPAWDDGQLSGGIRQAMPLVRFGQDSQHLLADEAVPRDASTSLAALEGDLPPSGINQLTQHPPLYYVVTGAAMKGIEEVAGGSVGSFVVETWVFRLMSVVFVAPLPLIIWHSARLLRFPQPVGVAASLVPLAIPQFVHLGSSVNNDTLLLLTFFLMTPLAIRLAGGDLRFRTASLAGAVTGIGLLTKGFALLILPWVAVALLLALYRGGWSVLRRVVIAGGVFGVTSIAFGGWWWIRNVILFGRLSPSRFNELVPTRDDVSLDLLAFLQRWSRWTTTRFWGSFGWFDTRLPITVTVAASVFVLAVLVVAVARRDRIAATPVGTRLLLLLPLVLLVGNQFSRALSGHLRTGQNPGLQGRYWFGALAAMSLLVALGLGHLVRGGYRWLPLGVFAAGTVLHVLAAGVLLGFYWGSPHSAIADRLRAVLAWAPVPSGVVIAGAVIGSLVVAVTAGRLVLLAVGRSSGNEAYAQA